MTDRQPDPESGCGIMLMALAIAIILLAGVAAGWALGLWF